MFTSLISPLSWFTSFHPRAATSTPRLLTRILGHVHFAHFSFTLVYFFPPQGRHIDTQALVSDPWSCSLRSFLLYLGLLLSTPGLTHPHPGSCLGSLVMFTSLISPLPWFTSFPLRAATSTPRFLSRILGYVHFAHFSFTLVYFFPPRGRDIHTQALDSGPWSCSLRSFLLYLGLLLSPSGPPHPHPGSCLESLVMFTSLISPLPWFTSFPPEAATSTPRLLTRVLGHVHFAHFSFTLVYFFPPRGRHIHTQALD